MLMSLASLSAHADTANLPAAGSWPPRTVRHCWRAFEITKRLALLLGRAWTVPMGSIWCDPACDPTTAAALSMADDGDGHNLRPANIVT